MAQKLKVGDKVLVNVSNSENQTPVWNMMIAKIITITPDGYVIVAYHDGQWATYSSWRVRPYPDNKLIQWLRN